MMPPALVSGLPLVALGLGAVVAMLLAPRAGRRQVRLAAGLAMGAALALMLARAGAPVVRGDLLADDGMARFGAVLVTLTGLGALVFLRPARPASEAPALILLATLGAALLCGAVHATTLFLGLELITLSLVALFVLPLSREGLEAGYKLLILGGIGAATLLMGLALGYAATGSMALDLWSARGAMVSLATALLLAGLAFKFAIVPFHLWTPDAFSGAPVAAAAFAGTGAKIGVAVVLLRLDAAGPPEPVWSLGLAVLGAASMLLGNLQALRQTSLVRMLGFSSIAHSGYLAALVAAGGAAGPEAVLFYLAGYAVALLAALCVTASLGQDCGLDDLRGLVWQRPLSGAALAVSLLSLAGLPVSVGFFGKFYLFSSLARTGAWSLLAIAIIGSAVGLYVYARYASFVFRGGTTTPVRAPFAPDAVLMVLCTVAILVLGVFPGPLVDAVRSAVN